MSELIHKSNLIDGENKIKNKKVAKIELLLSNNLVNK
jgi:hypothetical protein